jgi:hypothetical protein
MKILLPILMLLSFKVSASFNGAARIYNSGDKAKYPQLVSELMDEGMYFSAAPFLKEYISSSARINDAEVDRILDKLITEVGVKQFEVFPNSILEKSNATTIRYILARKAFRAAKYNDVLKYFQKNIEDWHPIKPYALLLEGSTYAVTKKEDQAVKTFKECVDVANDHINKEKNKDRVRQLKITRDYCVVGISRSQFAVTKFDDAYSSYLDLQKSSYIWPEILFEEAWNSFYLKDYNRTLGKLVTYKAPVLNYIFNPEIDVLTALTYMELCLWSDTNKVVEDFYTKYEKDYDSYKKFVNGLGKDYKQYYLLVKDKADGKLKGGEILNRALMSIGRDPAYIELFNSFNDGKEEIEKMKNISNPNLKAILNENLKESMTLQRNLIGSYVRGQMQLYGAQMLKAFEDMSYIKLEVLSKRKNELYSDVVPGERKRGDVAQLKRTDKQYFWTFNGEFWADELGDYVFSLKSECR